MLPFIARKKKKVFHFFFKSSFELFSKFYIETNNCCFHQLIFYISKFQFYLQKPTRLKVALFVQEDS